MLRILILSIIFASLAGCNLFSSKPSIAKSHTMSSTDTEAIHERALAGNGAAQYALAYRYYYGIGVPQNTNLAVQWMRDSKYNGYALAKSALPIIEAEDKKEKQQGLSNAAVNVAHDEVAPPAYMPEGPSNRHQYTHLLQESSVKKSDDFTVSILESNSLDHAKKFIIKNDLHHAVIREVKVGKKTRYQVLSGDFASARDAREHIKNMPTAIKELRPSVLPITRGDASQ
ncbi:MAG: SPOR domain-containing protein [Candidatus Thioglobus sp.]